MASNIALNLGFLGKSGMAMQVTDREGSGEG